MIKTGESNINNARFYKYYSFDDEDEVRSFIENINNINMIYDLKVDDDAEIDMLPVSGTYTAEELKKAYDTILKMSGYSKNLKIVLIGNYEGYYVDVQVFPLQKKMFLATALKNLEFNDLIAGKAKI